MTYLLATLALVALVLAPLAYDEESARRVARRASRAPRPSSRDDARLLAIDALMREARDEMTRDPSRALLILSDARTLLLATREGA